MPGSSQPNPNWPADPELSPDEKKQYDFLIGNNRWGEAFVLQQSFLLRKRLNMLNDVVQSLLQSSDRLETATKTLKESTDVQVKTIKRLLRSSLTLETLTVFLIVVAVLNIFVIIAQASGIQWSLVTVVLLAFVTVVLLVAAGLWQWLAKKESRSLAE